MSEEDKNMLEAGSEAKGETTPKNGRRRKIVLLTLLVIIIAVGSIWGIPYYRYMVSHESTDDAFLEGSVVYVSPRVSGHLSEVFVADNQWVEEGALLAKLEARDYEVALEAAKASLAAAEAKQSSSHLNVDLIKKTSNSGLSEAEASLSAADAAVEDARAQEGAMSSLRDQARATLNSAKAQLAKIKSDIEAAEANHRRDLADMERTKELSSSGVVSDQVVDHSVAMEKVSAAQLESVRGGLEVYSANLDAAQAAYEVAEENLKRAKSQLAARIAQREQVSAKLSGAQSAPEQVAISRSEAKAAAAEIERAKAGVERAELNLSYTKIVAPVSGYVTRKSAEPGTAVQVGQPLLALVPKEIWVIANFKETQLTDMSPNQPATIEVDAYPDLKLKAHVESIQRGTGARFSLLPPENATGNFIKVVQRVPVKLILDDPAIVDKYMLAPGMSVLTSVKTDNAGEGR
ncbi:MAG: HlyD family secretion protein [Deltaproteobacteria bacterium]|nr:MAG: HlyD family secretion protein [Deltaproteobacteria bacterium]